MKRILPIVSVVILIIALVFVNRAINRTARPDDDEASPAASSSPKASQSTAPLADTAAELSPEITVGDLSKAKHRITVGWVYDDTNEPNPQALVEALRAVQKVAQDSNGRVSAEIVNLDAPPTEVSPLAGSVTGLGIAVDGKPVGPAINPGEEGATVNIISQMLPRSIAQH